MSMKLKSEVIDDGAVIPDRYSRRGGNVSPPLAWTGLPSGTKSLALVVDDPDAPSGTFVHWLLYGIPAHRNELAEGMGSRAEVIDGLRQGRNGFGEIGYGGPQPPSGTHRYFFHLYALDSDVAPSPGVDRNELEAALRGHVLDEAQLMGRFGQSAKK